MKSKNNTSGFEFVEVTVRAFMLLCVVCNDRLITGRGIYIGLPHLQIETIVSELLTYLTYLTHYRRGSYVRY